MCELWCKRVCLQWCRYQGRILQMVVFGAKSRGKSIMSQFQRLRQLPHIELPARKRGLPNVITSGSKYLSIEIPQCKMRFLDSNNILPMALADLPEAFGIKEIAKGHFPHFFNGHDNKHVQQPRLPLIEYYHPEGMKPDRRKCFLQWYDAHKNDNFVFQELLKYCRWDVDILRKTA